MTNEELAVQIKQGHKEYITVLYGQIKSFLATKAFRYFNKYHELCDRCGVTVEDLTQEGYLAMTEAVQYYKPDGGNKLLTYFNYPFENRFRALTGRRTNRREPLNYADSLDAPLSFSDDTDYILEDTIEDENSESEFETVDENLYQSSLHDTLERGINQLCPSQQTVIRCRYYQKKTLEQTASTVGCKRDAIRQCEAKALRTLRTAKISRSLRSFLDDELYSGSLRGTGLSAFKNTGMSSVERTVERLYKYN